MSSLAIKQVNIIVTNADCMRARVRAPSMAWRAPFPRRRLPASIEFSIKLVCVRVIVFCPTIMSTANLIYDTLKYLDEDDIIMEINY